MRSTAQCMLYERDTESLRKKLQAMVFGSEASRQTRLHTLWTVLNSEEVDPGFYAQLLNHSNPSYRAWAM